VRPRRVGWVGNDSLMVDGADKGYSGGPKERKRMS